MKSTGARLLNAIGIFIIALIGLLLLGLILASIRYPYEYVYRIVAWGLMPPGWADSHVNDYLNNFPSHPLEAAPQPFIFYESGDDEYVAGTFEDIMNVPDFDAFLEENDTKAFIVIQDDAVLYEKYLNGAGRDSMMTSFSVAKSFTSALIGAAIDEGYINSVDDPITDYLPELLERDPRFSAIKIRHLLRMASGLEYQEDRLGLFNGDDPITTYYTDQRKAALEFTNIKDPPGEYFLYNKYHPQLLGLILERATGVPVTQYMQTRLWDQIGMEYDGSWSTDSLESGFEKMETGVNARAIDFAKFGRLYLENGKWDGVQVISPEWVGESTSPDPSTENDSYYRDEFGQTILNDLQGYYKYMWYGYFRPGGEPDFAAEGDHGQYIYVSPQKNLIIIRNGDAYGMTWDEWVKMFYEFASEL
jgi:CubicO group peptidase (beta-lactamase class C family)